VTPRVVRVEVAPTSRRALRALIALNVLVFVIWHLAVLGGDAAMLWMQANFLVSPAHLANGWLWTLLTSAISHTSLSHLAFNLWALWLFGRDVEDVVGARGFVHLYVAGAVMSSLGHVLYSLATGSNVPALGASGAVMAVAVVAALLYPRRMLLLFFVVPMTQLQAVGAFVLMDLFGMFSPTPDLIAHAAHLGGSLYGLLYFRYRVNAYFSARVRDEGANVVFQRTLGPPGLD
jgi:membrane associated rhomboid family serine protease